MAAGEVFDVLIIGCGAVGAAVAREMTLLGQKCVVLEKNMDVISEASSGNTGHLVRSYHNNIRLWPTMCCLFIGQKLLLYQGSGTIGIRNDEESSHQTQF